ncbi:MAG: protoglobin domain-containing protein [Phenylobacterium sp.]
MTSSNALAERLDFIKLTPAALRDIQGVKSIIMQELPGALDRFYEQVRATPQTRTFFSSEGHISGARNPVRRAQAQIAAAAQQWEEF